MASISDYTTEEVLGFKLELKHRLVVKLLKKTLKTPQTNTRFKNFDFDYVLQFIAYPSAEGGKMGYRQDVSSIFNINLDGGLNIVYTLRTKRPITTQLAVREGGKSIGFKKYIDEKDQDKNLKSFLSFRDSKFSQIDTKNNQIAFSLEDYVCESFAHQLEKVINFALDDIFKRQSLQTFVQQDQQDTSGVGKAPFNPNQNVKKPYNSNNKTTYDNNIESSDDDEYAAVFGT